MSEKSFERQDEYISYPEESKISKLARKGKEAPLLVVGISGCVLACIYGAYKFKHRGNMPISLYLIHLRLVAQGSIVGCLTLGLVHQTYKEFFGNKGNNAKKDIDM